MRSLLSVDSLHVALRDGPAIVDGVSFEIAPGETFALLGESGCGKSMTALSLMRLLPDGVQHAGGAVELEGMPLHGLSEREMRSVRGGKMAMIFQEPGLSLNPVMTVGQQIAEVLALHGADRVAAQIPTTNPSRPPLVRGGAGLVIPLIREGATPSLPLKRGRWRGVVLQRCIELLDQVGIPDAARRINEYPFQLSGGIKQRVMIAMALAGEPQLLIADEPTTALDVTIQAQVLQLLREMQAQRGMAMLLITHDLGVVAENAHRVGVMYAGQIVELASREQLFAQPLHPYTQKLFAALPDARRGERMLAAIPGNVPPLGSIRQGCRFAPRCDRAWVVCREQTPALVEVAGGRAVRCHLYTGPVADGALPVAENAGAGVRLSEADYTQQVTGEPLLQVADLQVHFPIRTGLLQRTTGHVKAVDGVSFEMAAGRTLALVGESGCGKTTLGKALLGLAPMTAGSLRFQGQAMRGPHALRGHAQMVFQDPFASLNPRMRIAEIIEEGMRAQTGQADHARINELLRQVGLDAESKWRYPHEFSGGQRQRIAIARALAVSPELLICDEPTSALDVSVQAQILNLLQALQHELGLSYLFITHNLAVVEHLADEVCVMYLGRIVERGATQAVMRSPKHPYTQALLAAVPRIDGAGRKVIKLEGELPSPAHPPAGCHFAPRCPQRMAVCSTTYPPEVTVGESHAASCYLYRL